MKKILVIQTASAGDVILVTPVLEKLHDSYPGAALDILVKKGNEKLFTAHPFLRQVWVWDKSTHKLKNWWELLQAIRREKFDMVINVQRYFSTGLLTALSGARITTGFRSNPLSFLFTHRVRHRFDGTHEVDRNLSLIVFIGKLVKYLPRLYPSVADFARVSQYKTRAFITISPASLWYTKQFPEEKWIEFIRSLPTGLSIILLGSTADAALCERIRLASQNPEVLNLAGKLNFLESAALMKDAGMNYVNDSAPMHLASAMNAPVAAIFCSTVPSFGFGPLSERSFVIEITEKLSCRPCGIHGNKFCPKGHFKCAKSIEIKQLIQCLPI